MAFTKSKVDRNDSRKKSLPKNEAFDSQDCLDTTLYQLWRGTISNEKSRLVFKLALYQVIKKERDQKSQERVFKISKVIYLAIISKVSLTKFHQN